MKNSELDKPQPSGSTAFRPVARQKHHDGGKLLPSGSRGDSKEEDRILLRRSTRELLPGCSVPGPGEPILGFLQPANLCTHPFLYKNHPHPTFPGCNAYSPPPKTPSDHASCTHSPPLCPHTTQQSSFLCYVQVCVHICSDFIFNCGFISV